MTPLRRYRDIPGEESAIIIVSTVETLARVAAELALQENMDYGDLLWRAAGLLVLKISAAEHEETIPSAFAHLLEHPPREQCGN